MGAYFDKEEDIAFNRINFSIEGLDEWMGMTGISYEENFDLEKPEMTIYYQKIPTDKFSLEQGIEILFGSGFTYSPGFTKATITHKSFIEITSDVLITLRQTQLYLSRLNNFFCLAQDKPVALKEVKTYRNDYLDDNQIPIPIEIYYQSLPHSESLTKINTNNFLFRYENVSKNLGDILSQWYQKYDELRPVFNAYFAATGTVELFLENKFLLLVQGLEVFHRRTSEYLYRLDSDTFESIRKDLIDYCPQDHRKWLKDKLCYANELSLRKRLEYLLNPIWQNLGISEDLKTLIHDIVQTRNYLTHFDKSIEKQAKRGDELSRLNRKIEILFQLLILKLIGLSEEQIDKIVKNNADIKIFSVKHSSKN